MSAGAAKNWPGPWSILQFPRRGRRSWTPGPPPGALPTASSPGAPGAVYAVDVGYGQLDASLRNDPRVAVLDRVNIRHLPKEAIPEPIDLATLDLSFISLTLVLPKILEFLAPGGQILAMVKPQFEVGKGQVGKGGVVRDLELQQAAVPKGGRGRRGPGPQGEPGLPLALKGPQGKSGIFPTSYLAGRLPGAY